MKRAGLDDTTFPLICRTACTPTTLPISGQLAFLIVLGAYPRSAWTGECEDGSRPPWVSETPRGYAYDYFIGSAESPGSGVEAEKLALANGIAEIGRHGLLTVRSETASFQEERSTEVEGGTSSTELVTRVAEEVRVSGHSTTLRGLSRVEHHTERCAGGLSRSYVLVRVPKASPESPPSTGYWAARSLVPSWAQFEKRHEGRAWLVLVGEALLVPTAVTTGILGSTARSDAAISTTQSDRDFYNDRADALITTALVTGAVALALYAYNVIDGIASEEWNVRE